MRATPVLSGVRATSEKRKVRKDERWASEEALLAEQIPSVSTRKRLRIGYNLESFSVKSAFVGINPLSWMKFAIRRADTPNDAIYRKRYAHVMKSA